MKIEIVNLKLENEMKEKQKTFEIETKMKTSNKPKQNSSEFETWDEMEMSHKNIEI